MGTRPRHSETLVNGEHPRVVALRRRLPPDSQAAKAVDAFFTWAGDRTLDGISSDDLKGWPDRGSDDGNLDDLERRRGLFTLGRFYERLRVDGLVRRNPAVELIGPAFYGYRGQVAAPFTAEEVRRLMKPPKRRAGVRELRNFLICAFSLVLTQRPNKLSKIVIPADPDKALPLQLRRQLPRYLKLYRPRTVDRFLFPRISNDHRQPRIDGSAHMTAEAIRRAMRRHAESCGVAEKPAPKKRDPAESDRFIATHYDYFPEFHGGWCNGEWVPSVVASTIML
jgi:hypothetical protein